MTHKVPPNHPLWQYFAGTVEDAFYTQLGICSPDLVRYLTELLVDFVHIREIYALRDAGGGILNSVSNMLIKSYLGPDLATRTRERLVHRHIGDFTLYWAGVYPESLGRLCARGQEDYLMDYYSQGKKSYAIASELTGSEELPPASVLRQLSEYFEDCAYGLSLVRSNWDDGEHDDQCDVLLD